MKRSAILCSVLSFWLLLAVASQGAEVRLSNGKVLKGKLLEEDDLQLKLLVGDTPIILLKSIVVSVLDDEGNVRIIGESSVVEEPTGKVESATEAPAPVSTPVSAPMSTPVSQPTMERAAPQEQPPAKAVAAPALGTLEKLEPMLPLVLPAGKSYCVQGAMLNVRSGPSADYPKVGAVRKDAVLVELDRQGNWIQGRQQDGTTGWVYSDYLAPMKDELVACTAEQLNFRQGPGVGFASLRKLGHHELLLLLDQQGEWVQLRDSEGVVGWASAQYLAKIADLDALQPDYQVIPGEQDVPALLVQREANKDTGTWSLRVAVSEDDWLLGGKLTLVIAAAKAEAKAWDQLFQGKDILSKFSFHGPQALETLGLEGTLGGNAEAVQRLVLIGQQKGKSWIYEVRQTSADVPGLEVYIVGQRGKRRAVLHPL